jgi:hypothetical protein
MPKITQLVGFFLNANNIYAFNCLLYNDFKVNIFWHYFCKPLMSSENDMKKLNCWEIKKCGREPDGSKTEELGVCPATHDKSYDGLNSGDYAGRICWSLVGTLCEGKVRGHFAKSVISCLGCEVFKQVRNEEGLGSFVIRSKSLPVGW